ncbi:restriction endonuclease subunit S [uncultured Bacteroides sp.]|uniref:restriction endonuclease subunit S n=1 Tax=uncultured Bacteroides sp. TaxID=162156 RepID=UPI002AAA9A74|nr:restriction endonuclease subunit S [uncultured Bacteroides sp.]
MKQDNEHIPEGYKNSPLGVIPEGWKVKRLGEICPVFKSGHSITSQRIFEQEQYPVYGGNGLRGYTNTYTHNGKYILIGRQGALCGNINFVDGEIYISEHAIAVQPNAKNNIKFLMYKLDFWKLNRYSESSAQPGLSVEKLIKYRIALPPLPEQKKVAEILSTWDEAIERQSKLIDALTLRKRGLMQQLLSGKKRFMDFTGKLYVKHFRDLFLERNETHRENLPLLSITADRGVILQSESDKRDISNNDKSKYKRICSNDIGYNTMRMWQGRSALSSMEGIVSPAYTIITPKESVHPLYMAMLCKQPRVVYDFWTHSQGLVSDTLNCKFLDFGQVKVSIPTFAEQTVIAERLTTADIEIELAKQKLSHLRNQKRGLMQQLLTGKKRVKL